MGRRTLYMNNPYSIFTGVSIAVRLPTHLRITCFCSTYFFHVSFHGAVYLPRLMFEAGSIPALSTTGMMDILTACRLSFYLRLRRFAVYTKKSKGGVTVNERQKRFAEYYAQSGNASLSAKKAGYSEKFINTNATKLLQNTTISEYIKELTEKEQDKRIMTARERRAVLSDIAREGNTQDRIRAIDVLNKMSGEYITKIEGNLSAEINNPFKDLTTEELRKLAHR